MNHASPAEILSILIIREFFRQKLSDNYMMRLGQSEKDRVKVKVINNNFFYSPKSCS